VDDAVRKGFTDLSIAIVEQSFRYARGNVACQDGDELGNCQKCELCDSCRIVRIASVLEAEAKIWLTTDGIDFMQSIGLDYSADDIRRLI
jgi:hypothetical protein